MKISVLIPTFNRPDTLRLVIKALQGQDRRPDQIVFCQREDDEVTRRLLSQLNFPECEWEVAKTAETGVVASMNAGLSHTRGDIVALLDDDAVPRPDWIHRIATHFESPELLGVGGRDVQDYIEDSRLGVPHLRVGSFTKLGKLLGNHHVAIGAVQKVMVLKGCNCAYRGNSLRRFGFDLHLRGAGAQVGWEVSLAFDFSTLPGNLIYDPDLVVDHLIAPRADGDTNHRGIYNARGAYDIAWNQFSVTLRKAPGFLKFRILAWELLIGSPVAPGILRIGDHRLGSIHERIRKIGVSLAAFWSSFREDVRGDPRLKG